MNNSPNAEAVGRRINSCIKELARSDFESALLHYAPAINNTASRRRPNAGTGDAIRRFIADQEWLITEYAFKASMTGWVVGKLTFPEAIYNLVRNPLAHEGELDARIKFVDTQQMNLSDSLWEVPNQYIGGLVLAVVAATENAGVTAMNGQGTVKLMGRDWIFNDLWGEEDTLRELLENKHANNRRHIPKRSGDSYRRYKERPDPFKYPRGG